MKREIKVAEGLKISNQLTSKLGDYLGLFNGSNDVTGILKRGNMCERRVSIRIMKYDRELTSCGRFGWMEGPHT